jgi:hypothetical protein
MGGEGIIEGLRSSVGESPQGRLALTVDQVRQRVRWLEGFFKPSASIFISIFQQRAFPVKLI